MVAYLFFGQIYIINLKKSSNFLEFLQCLTCRCKYPPEGFKPSGGYALPPATDGLRILNFKILKITILSTHSKAEQYV